MRQTQLFSKTKKHAPRDEESINAKLLTQGGFIKKLMAGVYSYLPLGLRVLNNINKIIRKEIEAIGGQELYMPALQPKELWHQTGRWDVLSQIMYQFKDQSEKEIGLAPTHEEVITDIAQEIIISYKDLPKYVYQIQDKFRNEPRARSGLIRCREFTMKDLYSFHALEEDLNKYYDQVSSAYQRIFKTCGLTPMVVEASGGDFTKQYSHEFQVPCPAGEDKIVFCAKCEKGQNTEISSEANLEVCPSCQNRMETIRSIEVGNIFKLGTKFAHDLNLFFTNDQGQKKPVFMGCYGIGPGRLMGTIVEVSNDKNGIIWPKTVAPFAIHLLNLSGPDKEEFSNTVYSDLQNKGFEVLYDDRQESPGIKLKDADLIGLPARLIISNKTDQKVELKFRDEKKAELLTQEALFNKLTSAFRET